MNNYKFKVGDVVRIKNDPEYQWYRNYLNRAFYGDLYVVVRNKGAIACMPLSGICHTEVKISTQKEEMFELDKQHLISKIISEIFTEGES